MSAMGVGRGRQRIECASRAGYDDLEEVAVDEGTGFGAGFRKYRSVN